MKLKIINIYFIITTLLISGGLILAGTSITNIYPPTPTMYSIDDIYALIDSTATSTPVLSPAVSVGTPSMHSISELYVKLANLIDQTKLASSSVTYLGVTGGITPTEVATITKDFIPTTVAGDITGYTLDDIYNLITNNTRPLTPAHTFAPGSAPASTQYTLTDIYTSLSTLIDPATVATGTIYLGRVGTHETFAVVFDGQGGTPDFSTTTDIEYGSNITLPANPTKDGYVFSGWYTEPNGGGVQFTETTPVSESIVVYGKWGVAPAHGDHYGGGIVFYVNGSHGLISAISSQGSVVQWGCGGTIISGADGAIIGTGRQNTLDILASCVDRPIAASVCSSYNGGGYMDWYLPSINELREMYIDRTIIGGFPSGHHWSSTEADANSAITQNFSSFGNQFSPGKNLSMYVRCVRSY